VDFEWNPAKATSNLAKHGVGFEDAIEVFDDPDRLERVDPGFRGELRFQAIGTSSGRILFVSYTLRGAVCRIISVRRASRREREAYTVPAGS
jgi:uncharacterized DUF497 family protein